mgnify:CR=1 FL=1
MKEKNWRENEPPKRRRRRRRKGGLWRKLRFAVVLFLVGYVGFLVYYNFGKPYTVALDAGHGGADVGAEGVIQEVALTEQTVAALQTLLEEDGRFRVVLSRKAGEGATVTERNHKFRRRHPDLMLSVHGNASDSSSANGFECYPSPPGYENHEERLAFAACLAQEMQNIGANLRGTGIAGVRYGYYDENGNKLLDGISRWIFMDSEKRKPANVPADMVEKYHSGQVSAIEGEKFFMPKTPAGRLICVRDFVVTRRDTDTNGHANNVKYLEWVMDDIPDAIYEDMTLKDIRIVYRKECLRGDTVTIKTYLQDTENGKEIESFLYEGETIVAQVITLWA